MTPRTSRAIDVFFEGRPAGVATPFVIGRHTHRAVPQSARPEHRCRPVSTTWAWWRPPTRSKRAPASIDFSQLAMFEGDAEEAQ